MLPVAQEREVTEEVVGRATATVRDQYNRIARFYDLQEALAERQLGPWRKKLWAYASGRILEVGVGTGRNFPYYPAGADATAIDVADQMLARARARRLGTAVDLREGDVQALDFPDASFDTSAATFVFCSVPDPVRGLRELGRVVKPGGRILLLEHVRVDRPIIGWLMDLFNAVTVWLSGFHINRPTVENVQRAGLEIESIEHFGPMRIVKLIVARPGKGPARPDPSLRPATRSA
jgi:ubiquinone/menaquinone biosynthesis C-methylase UbiE